MKINPQGLKIQSRTTRPARCSRTSGITWSRGSTASRSRSGSTARGGELEASGPIRPGDAPLRIGAAGQGRARRLSCSMPTSPCRRSTARRCRPTRSQARFASQALCRDRPSPESARLLAARRGTGRSSRRRVAASSATDGSSTTATWMIGGPSFDADVPRFGNYDPAKDPTRGHGLRLASDDLFDCRWKATHEYRLPENARSGIYAGRIRFSDRRREASVSHGLHREEGGCRGPRRRSRSCARPTPGGPTRRRRSARPGRGSRSRSATTVSPTAPAIRRRSASIGRIMPGRGRICTGFRMPWPVVGPYTLMGPEEWDYSHLCRQDRFTQAWLETQGYAYDVLERHRSASRPASARRIQGAVRRRTQ